MKPRKRIFCPLEQDVVNPATECETCPFWDGQCSFSYRLTPTAKFGRLLGRIWARLTKRRRLPRRGGRRVRVPPVWEKRPAEGSGGDRLPSPDDEQEYGVAGLLAEEPVSPTKRPENDDEEEFDSLQPGLFDVPLEIEESETALAAETLSPDLVGPVWPECGPLPEIMPQGLQENPLPFGPSLGPEPWPPADGGPGMPGMGDFEKPV